MAPPAAAGSTRWWNWQGPLIERLRAGIARQALSEGQSEEDWLRRRIGYLSPYLMPWPLAPTARSDTVAEFEADGFATGVALPLRTPSTTALVSQKLAALDEHSVLFLDRLTALSVMVPGQAT
jgi:hypothetical protein